MKVEQGRCLKFNFSEYIWPTIFKPVAISVVEEIMEHSIHRETTDEEQKSEETNSKNQ